MAKMKLKQLRDADVRYISLVDRAATRIPFRVLKRDKESKMGIDLTKVFKSDNTGKPYVSALVVFAQKNEAAGTQIHDAIKAHGFTTERVQKSDEGETLVFAQADQSGETQIVRLSDQMLVNVSGLKMPAGWMGEMIEQQSFFPDLKLATEALYEQVALVSKSDTPQEDASAVLGSYAAYLDQMVILPSACFKLDEVINEIVRKCSCEETEKGEVKPGETPAKNPAAEAIKEESEADKKKRAANHPPAEMAPKDEEDDQKPPPDETYKAEVLAALSGLKDTITSLSTKVEAVATEQGEQKKVLDEVVKKADTLNETLESTVSAPPVSPDRPAHSTRMRVDKKDDDPRTGTFDTAFLRRRK